MLVCPNVGDVSFENLSKVVSPYFFFKVIIYPFTINNVIRREDILRNRILT